MKMKAGFSFYKEREFIDTVIGQIPNQWGVVPLKKVVEINRESRDPSTESPDGEFLYIDIESIEGNTGIISNPKKILGRDAPSRARRVVHYKDVIMSTVRPYLKAFAIVPKEYDSQICSTGLAVLSCRNNILPDYLLEVLFSSVVIEQCTRMMVGGQYPALNESQVSQIIIPLPASQEQENIARILSTVDGAIRRTGEIIAKTELLKKGLMHELLSRGIGHREFKDREIGKLPREWEVVRLGIKGRFQYGITTSALEESSGVRLLRITDITNHGIDWSKTPYCNVTADEFRKYKLRVGDVLFARIGATTGKTCYIDRPVEAVFGSYLIRFQPSGALDTRFLYYYAQSRIYWNQVNRKKEGQLKKGLNIVTLGSLLFPLPALAEQQEIANTLLKVDNKLELERKEKGSLEKTKQGLMDLLLTGKIRIKVV